MIYQAEDLMKKKLIIECDCGCEAIVLTKSKYKDGSVDYWISIMYDGFYTKQTTLWDRFKDRVKNIWFLLRKGEYSLCDIVINPEQMAKLKEVINEM